MKLTRRQLARYLADGLERDRTKRLNQVAAWLVANHRGGDVQYLARDVQSILATRGHVAARVTSARKLSTATTRQIETLLQSAPTTTIELKTTIDPSLGGGFRLETPDAELDSTISTKLHHFVTEMTS